MGQSPAFVTVALDAACASSMKPTAEIADITEQAIPRSTG
jgi:hypothetical protein